MTARENQLHTCPKCKRRFPGNTCRACLPKDVAASLTRTAADLPAKAEA